MFTEFWPSVEVQAVVKDFTEDDAGEWRRVVEWLSLIVGAVDEPVVVGIGIVRTGISLVADMTGSLLGRGGTGSHGVLVYLSCQNKLYKNYLMSSTPRVLLTVSINALNASPVLFINGLLLIRMMMGHLIQKSLPIFLASICISPKFSVCGQFYAVHLCRLSILVGWDVKVVLPSSQKSWIGKLSLYLKIQVCNCSKMNRKGIPYKGDSQRKLLLPQGRREWRIDFYFKASQIWRAGESAGSNIISDFLICLELG